MNNMGNSSENFKMIYEIFIKAFKNLTEIYHNNNGAHHHRNGCEYLLFIKLH